MGNQLLTPDYMVSRRDDSISLHTLEETENESLDALVVNLMQRCPQPVDIQEVAALLESLGVIDDVARLRYGADDTFDLARIALAQMHATKVHSPVLDRPGSPVVTLKMRLLDYARGPQSLAVIVLLILIIVATRHFGAQSEAETLAVSFGISGSMLATNGFVQAGCRRMSIYLSRENPLAARRYLALLAPPILGAVVGIGILAAVGLIVVGGFDLFDVGIFLVAYNSLSLIWLVSTILNLVEQSTWLGIALSAGLLVGFVSDRLVALLAPFHIVVGCLTGFALTLGLVLWVIRKQMADARDTDCHFTLPATSYLVLEGIPFFVYGLSYMLFIFFPHMVGGFWVLPDGLSRMALTNIVEISLTASLMPLILVSGVMEHSVRRFWVVARVAMRTSPGDSPESFALTIRRFMRGQLIQYLAALALASVLLGVTFAFALEQGFMDRWLPISNQAPVSQIFFAGLLAYGLIGWSLFNFMLCTVLDRSSFALPAIAAGLVAEIAAGMLCVWGGDYSYVGVVFLVGAAVIFVGSTLTARHLLQQIDYYYQSSF